MKQGLPGHLRPRIHHPISTTTTTTTVSNTPALLSSRTDWDSIDAHTAFTRSSAYKPFSKHLSAILLDPPRYYHARFPRPFEHAAGAAVTELATFHFDGGADAAAFEGNAARFAETLTSSAAGLRDVSMGWAVEEVEHPELQGGKGKAFVLAIGWTGVDAHMAYRETEAFKDSVHLLREGPEASEMVSARLLRVRLACGGVADVGG